MERSRINIEWSLFNRDNFLYLNDSVARYFKSGLESHDIINFEDFTSNFEATLLGTIRDKSRSQLRCYAWNSADEQHGGNVLAFGFDDGKVILRKFDDATFQAHVGLDEQRSCNVLAWNLGSYYLAEGTKKSRKGNLVIWDVSSAFVSEKNNKKALYELGKNESHEIVAVDWIHAVSTGRQGSQQLISVGDTHSRTISLYDLRSSQHPEMFSCYPKPSPSSNFHNVGIDISMRSAYFSLFHESAVSVYDLRQLLKPLHIFQESTRIGSMHWCPTRDGLLSYSFLNTGPQQPSSYIKLIDAIHMPVSNDKGVVSVDDNEPIFLERTFDTETAITSYYRCAVNQTSPHSILAHSWHPSRDGVMLISLGMRKVGSTLKNICSEATTNQAGQLENQHHNSNSYRTGAQFKAQNLTGDSLSTFPLNFSIDALRVIHISEKFPSAISCLNYLSYVGSSSTVEVSPIPDSLSKTDISALMLERARREYGLNSHVMTTNAKHIFVHNDDALGNLWSWFNRLSRLTHERVIPPNWCGIRFYGVNHLLDGLHQNSLTSNYSKPSPLDGLHRSPNTSVQQHNSALEEYKSWQTSIDTSNSLDDISSVNYVDVKQSERKIYTNESRRIALEICGWPTDSHVFASKINSLCHDGYYTKAAAIALFNLDAGQAVAALRAGAAVANYADRQSFQMMIMTLVTLLSSPASVNLDSISHSVSSTSSTTKDVNSNTSTPDELFEYKNITDEHFWNMAIANERNSLSAALDNVEDAYVKAMLLFAANSDSYKQILCEGELAVSDRVAFACKYLSDNEIVSYLRQLTRALVGTKKFQPADGGILDGFLLTGMTDGSEFLVNISMKNEEKANIVLSTVKTKTASTNSTVISNSTIKSDYNGLALLQRYVDRTGDVQTAATLVNHVVDLTILKDPRPYIWLSEYCDLLDQWRLFHHRTALTCHWRHKIAALLRSPSHTTKYGESNFLPPSDSMTLHNSSLSSGVSFLYHFAHESTLPLTAIDDSNLVAPTSGAVGSSLFPTAARGSSSLSSATSGVVNRPGIKGSSTLSLAGTHLGLKNDNLVAPGCVYISCSFCSRSIMPTSRSGALLHFSNRPRSMSCPNCRKPLPRCCICLQNMGTNSGLLYLSPAHSAANKDGTSIDVINSKKLTPLKTWVTWCQSCRHGGHAEHLSAWFQMHSGCPVNGCKCLCMQPDKHDDIFQASGSSMFKP